MKLMVIGDGEHGKDSVCQILKEYYGLSFTSSSMFACELFIYNLLKDTHGYSTIEECFNDRRNHRAVWHQLIKEYQGDSKTMLSRAIFAKYDVYCGNRSSEEIQAAYAQGLFDICIWVDAIKRLPPEDSSSTSVTVHDAHFVVDNNGREEELPFEVRKIMTEIHTRFSKIGTQNA